MRVYPRACGGTPPQDLRRSRRRGLSPRVRGNHRFLTISCERARVYPRACGGTDSDESGPNGGHGLSPRVRGNLLQVLKDAELTGSIPARAGEPRSLAPGLRQERVYPRACGGTSLKPSRRVLFSGLSPRVRGNRPDFVVSVTVTRSIPARAGEPRLYTVDTDDGRVYPRACGGTRQRS